jgi:hypothetical protein
MDRGLRRRLDVLIWLTASLHGLALTYVFLSEHFSGGVLLFAIFPTVLILGVAYFYIDLKTVTVTNDGGES